MITIIMYKQSYYAQTRESLHNILHPIHRYFIVKYIDPKEFTIGEFTAGH